jgi:mmpl domain protein
VFTIQGKSHAAFTRTQQLSNELAQRFPSANRGSGQIILTTGDGTALTEL